MPNKFVSACLDSNVLISAAAFGGNPKKILDRLWDREFSNVTCEAILTEVQRNLAGKLALNPDKLAKFLADLRAASTVVKPTGSFKTSSHGPDNLVLETAVLGGCDALVTGDKQHLLPLGTFQGIAIEAPAVFLKRLG